MSRSTDIPKTATDLRREHGSCAATFYASRARFWGQEASVTQKLKFLVCGGGPQGLYTEGLVLSISMIYPEYDNLLGSWGPQFESERPYHSR